MEDLKMMCPMEYRVPPRRRSTCRYGVAAYYLTLQGHMILDKAASEVRGNVVFFQFCISL